MTTFQHPKPPHASESQTSDEGVQYDDVQPTVIVESAYEMDDVREMKDGHQKSSSNIVVVQAHSQRHKQPSPSATNTQSLYELDDVTEPDQNKMKSAEDNVVSSRDTVHSQHGYLPVVSNNNESTESFYEMDP